MTAFKGCKEGGGRPPVAGGVAVRVGPAQAAAGIAASAGGRGEKEGTAATGAGGDGAQCHASGGRGRGWNGPPRAGNPGGREMPPGHWLQQVREYRGRRYILTGMGQRRTEANPGEPVSGRRVDMIRPGTDIKCHIRNVFRMFVITESNGHDFIEWDMCLSQ